MMLTTHDIIYQDNTTLCHGFLAYNNSTPAPKPAVLIAPDWGGRGDDACAKAIELAQLGYVGFAVDMYGDGQLGHDDNQRRALMTPLLNDRTKLLARITCAYQTLSALAVVDATRIAAIGYCFGGLCVLDLARANVGLKAAASFHGLLSAPDGAALHPIEAKLLILHGYDDPLISPTQINQFAQEMTSRQADWQVHMYGLTAHSFTNPAAHGERVGLQYNKQADERSWVSVALFLDDNLR